ncbi:NAD(P)/FAD-dependent oxidoreductase [Desulfosediminicola flagellatus]|uniref:NAD(P)/FAD-dependent oxidoreductase n=1 Tax=Desulfosediminicola flagellatus TaxID=2569541 RepID=UPI001C3D4BE3|nr:FAD/NAD(P)-binding oxidoreductase [Desulfosediminicola flagellatus]
MKKLVILGAGCGGTMMANKMRKHLDDDWSVTIIDRNNIHDYQPGYLFVPFDINKPKDIRRTKKEFMNPGIDFVVSEITNVDWNKQEVTTGTEGKFSYDILIMSTGCDIRPDEIEGLKEGWGNDIHGFYRYDDCIALGKALKKFEGGKLVVNIAEMPIKCPVAPLEFVFLADWWLTKQGKRDKTEIEFVTPLSGAFTKPVATRILTSACEEKNIKITPNFALGSVDPEKKIIEAYDGTQVDYDMLVSIPPNFGDEAMIESEVADPMGYIPVDKHTLQPAGYDNVWVLGDGTDVPTSKAGAVAHFQGDILEENIMAFVDGGEQHARSDGHAV